MQLHKRSTEAEDAATTATGTKIVMIAIATTVIVMMTTVTMTGEDVVVITKR